MAVPWILETPKSNPGGGLCPRLYPRQGGADGTGGLSFKTPSGTASSHHPHHLEILFIHYFFYHDTQLLISSFFYINGTGCITVSLRDTNAYRLKHVSINDTNMYRNLIQTCFDNRYKLVSLINNIMPIRLFFQSTIIISTFFNYSFHYLSFLCSFANP